MNDFTSIRWVPIGAEAPTAGDRVSREAGGLPVYHIVSVENGEAWLIRPGREGLEKRPLEQFHWKVAQTA